MSPLLFRIQCTQPTCEQTQDWESPSVSVEFVLLNNRPILPFQISNLSHNYVINSVVSCENPQKWFVFIPESWLSKTTRKYLFHCICICVYAKKLNTQKSIRNCYHCPKGYYKNKQKVEYNVKSCRKSWETDIHRLTSSHDSKTRSQVTSNPTTTLQWSYLCFPLLKISVSQKIKLYIKRLYI